MRLKQLSACAVVLTFLLGLGLATSAQAAGKKWPLTGGGAQIHIGNGLALPIQAAIPQITTPPSLVSTGTVFPPLLIPVKSTPHPPVIRGTTDKPLQTTPTSMGIKSAYQRRLFVPNGAMSKAPAQTTVGVKFSNPSAFAVGTNLRYVWPGSGASGVTFSTGNAPPPVIAAFGGTMTYFNALGTRFGGAAQFSLSPGAPAGLLPAPVTVYIKINGTTPPCTHPAFAGPASNAGCVAGMLQAKPTGKAAIGGPFPGTLMTPGGPVTPLNIAIVKMGSPPLGTISAAVLAAFTPLPTNMATSANGPWTTGQIAITNMGAVPSEMFTLSGKDSRAAGGSGTIQMVAGSLSKRFTTGPNANRGWVRLILGPAIAPVPSMSMLGLATTVALMLLGFAYATRRRLLA